MFNKSIQGSPVRVNDIMLGESIKKSTTRKQEISLLEINENIQESLTSLKDDQINQL